LAGELAGGDLTGLQPAVGPLQLRGGDQLGDQGEGCAFGEELTGAQDEGDRDQQGDAQGAGDGGEGEDRDDQGAQQVNNPDGAAPVPPVDQRPDRQPEHQPRDGAGSGDKRHQAGIRGQVHGQQRQRDAAQPITKRGRGRGRPQPPVAATQRSAGWCGDGHPAPSSPVRNVQR